MKNKSLISHWFVVGIAIVSSFLASLLLFDLAKGFYIDWNDHCWLIEYFGECLKNHRIPDMIHTIQYIGLANGIFYAHKFYALAGMISVFIGSAMTVRILVIISFILQFLHVYRTAFKAGSSRNISLAIAVMMTWAIYPLSNLYNRSALTEFFSVIFLTISLSSFLVILMEKKEEASKYDKVAAGLFFALAAVTHPLTAYFGGVFLGVLGIVALIFCQANRRFKMLRFFCLTAFFSLLILSPWAYLFGQFHNKLSINAPLSIANNFKGGWFYPDSIDSVWARLSLLPLDTRAIKNGLSGVSTPYLDAQIMMPFIILIVLIGLIRIRERRKENVLSSLDRALIFTAGLILILAFVVSVYPTISGYMGGFFNILQFPYRLTTYVNLSALVMLIVLSGSLKDTCVKDRQMIHICFAFCLGISLTALALKLVHADAITVKTTDHRAWVAGSNTIAENLPWTPTPFRSVAHLNYMPATYYSVADYCVDEGMPKVTSANVPVIYAPFNVLDTPRLGQLEDIDIERDQQTLVVTNVQPFSWNRISVDDKFVLPPELLEVDGRDAFLLPPGRHHLKVVSQVDEIWSQLNVLSWYFLIGWIVLYFIVVMCKAINECKRLYVKEEKA